MQSHDIIAAAYSRLTSLRELKVPKISASAPEVSIDSLQLLQVDYVLADEIQATKTFLSHNSSLQKLKIDLLSRGIGLEMLLPPELINLKELLIASYVTITDHTLQKLHSLSPRLQKIITFDRNTRSSFEENISYDTNKVFRLPLRLNKSNCFLKFSKFNSFVLNRDMSSMEWEVKVDDDEEFIVYDDYGNDGNWTFK